ncbi:MAG: hypothetical protein E6Q88_13820 [Lysobacteraceae bacterium]|nr:MAG: hypothetical protein E6Q88_13820 [Xanthomonadaceae bacterium]
MKKTILEIYALAVCFAAVVCATVTLGFGLWSVLEIAMPEFTINGYTYARYQDNESFRPNKRRCADEDVAIAEATAATAATDGAATTADLTADANADKRARDCRMLSDIEITAEREKAWGRELREERRDGLQALVRCLLILLVNLLVFLPHWLLAKRARAAGI